MFPKVASFEHLHDYILHIRFTDGLEGDVDLQDELRDELFLPLKEVAFFRQVTINPDFYTLSWPNGADLAPEYLYEKVMNAVGNRVQDRVAETSPNFGSRKS